MKSKASEAASYLAALSNVKLTDKQIAARRENMARAREVRLKKLAAGKENSQAKENKQNLI